MHQRNSATSGRPSGTDGSDYSYRMVVDSRYKMVAQAKQSLFIISFLQALFICGGSVYLFLVGAKKVLHTSLAIASILFSVLSLIVGDFGRRKSRIIFLKFYMIASSIALILLSAALADSYSVLEDIRVFPTLRPGLIAMVCIFTSWMFQILVVIRTVTSLIRNMSPPKRAN